MKTEENDKNVIMNDIKSVSTNETWIIIGGKKKWVRKCPDCNNQLFYSFKTGLIRANKRNCRCSSCDKINRYKTTDISLKISNTLKGRIFSESHKKKLSLSSKGKNNIMYGKKGELNPFYGKKHSSETKQKISAKSKKQNLGRKHSAITRKLWRQISLDRKKKLGIYSGKPFYNPIACKFIEKYGIENKLNFQHALNEGEYEIKELHYWVDGYDKNKNIVFEYNEPHHYDLLGKLKDRDRQRLLEIKNLLKCKIIIYNGFKKEIEVFE